MVSWGGCGQEGVAYAVSPTSTISPPHAANPHLLQNNVLELWSLFDFLLPGFLGTERQFYQRFGKPIILSRDAKSSSKEQEAGMPVIHVHVVMQYPVVRQ